MGYLDLGNQEPSPPVPWEVSSVIDEPPRQWYSAAVARMDLRSQSRKEEAPELHLAFCQLHGIEGLSGSTLRSLLACMLTGDCTSVFCTLWTLCSGPPDPGATQESRLWKRASGNFNDENAIWGRILSLETEFKHKDCWADGVLISELYSPLGGWDWVVQARGLLALWTQPRIYS